MASNKRITCNTCTKRGRTAKEALKLTREFSMLKSGKLSDICKQCRTELSKEWTDSVKDYRILYQLARQLVQSGLKVRVPTAKGYRVDPTLRFTNNAPVNLEKVKLQLRKARKAERQTATAV